MNKKGTNEITLLTGANCVQELEPRQIIASQKGGPYAFKITLGRLVSCRTNAN